MTVVGERKAKVKEKWEIVTSHKVRRSFATNLYKSVFPSRGIMAITGYKTEEAFGSYIKVNEEGSEAAAATGLMIRMSWSPPLQAHFDRPFVFFLRDELTGLFLESADQQHIAVVFFQFICRNI